MDKKNKEEMIEYLNLNFRAILSWGAKGVVPTGIFKVKDIVVGEIPEEYEDMKNVAKHVTQIILVQEDDDSKEIDIPLDIFLEKFVPAAQKNTESFDMGSNIHNNPEKFVERTSRNFAKSPYFELLPEGEAIYLDYEENGIQYYEDGKMQEFTDPFCIFPVDLGMYRERQREITYLDFEEMKKIEEEKLRELYEKKWMKPLRDKDIEPKPYGREKSKEKPYGREKIKDDDNAR